MTTFYLDTSVAVHALLGTRSAEEWFDATTGAGRLISSRILKTELTRVLRREEWPVLKRDEVLDHVALIRLNDSALTIAESLADHVKTLDAIHLASAIVAGPDVVVSHDANLRDVARQLGFETFDPIS